MKVNLKRLNNDFHFVTTNERGDEVHLDNKSAENPQGSSPMDLLLRGIAGCSGIDIVHILKKQNLELTNLEMEVEGYRDPNAIPKVFEKIDLQIKLEGDLPENKARRAVDLSLEKYCSVAKMLEKTAEIKYEVFLNGTQI